MTSSITDFYDPLVQEKDYKGRTLDFILSWPDTRLERSHDYIQVLFPLPESSPFNHAAPVVDYQTFAAFRARPELRARLRESFLRILKFLGFKLFYTGDRENMCVTTATNFISSARNWFYPFDHNHLRITRMIRCLRILGLEEEALELYSALERLAAQYKGRLGKSSLMYWKRAALRPLYAKPEDEDVDISNGLDFLVEFEKSREGQFVFMEEAKQGGKEDDKDYERGPAAAKLSTATPTKGHHKEPTTPEATIGKLTGTSPTPLPFDNTQTLSENIQTILDKDRYITEEPAQETPALQDRTSGTKRKRAEANGA